MPPELNPDDEVWSPIGTRGMLNGEDIADEGDGLTAQRRGNELRIFSPSSGLSEEPDHVSWLSKQSALALAYDILREFSAPDPSVTMLERRVVGLQREVEARDAAALRMIERA